MLEMEIIEPETLEMEVSNPNTLEMELTGQEPSKIDGTSDYDKLLNKPQINDVELNGNKTLDELGIQHKGNYMQATDLGDVEDHSTAESMIFDQLKPDDVPSGKYYYVYFCQCRGDSVFAICHKIDGEIAITFLSSYGHYRISQYDFYNDEITNQHWNRIGLGGTDEYWTNTPLVFENYISFNGDVKVNQQSGKNGQVLKTTGKNVYWDYDKGGVIDLGEIDLQDYNDDIWEFVNTLTEDGVYKFYDREFHHIVEVQNAGHIIAQKTWSSEEGPMQEYYRQGYMQDGELVWEDLGSYATYEQVANNFAVKSHIHYQSETVTNLANWLNKPSTNNVEGLPYRYYRLRYNAEHYVVQVGYDTATVMIDGKKYMHVYETYYKENEPHKIYYRKGIRLHGVSPARYTWEKWHVSSTTIEYGQYSSVDEALHSVSTTGTYTFNVLGYEYKAEVYFNSSGGVIYQKVYAYGDDHTYEEMIRTGIPSDDGNNQWGDWQIIVSI